MKTMENQNVDTTTELLSSAVEDTGDDSTEGNTQTISMDKEQAAELVEFAEEAVKNIRNQIATGAEFDPE